MRLKGSRALFAAGATVLALGTALGATAPRRITMQHGPISVDAESTEIDYGTHQAKLKNVAIAQGDLRVSADRAAASGFNTDDSRWTFTGNVHITSEKLGVLTSESATVDFRNNQLASALVEGHPAEFEQTSSKTGVLARGHAESIQYSVAADTVRLTGNAALQYGATETTAPLVVYNIRDQKLQFAGAATPGKRVHIETTPQKLPRAGAKPGTKPGAAPRLPAGSRSAASRSASGPS